MKRALVTLACAVAVLAGCASDEPSKTDATPWTARALAGAPAPLAKLHDEAGKLLGGGESAFAARLRTLRGHPVVVNKWASWCGPCRAEFPHFRRQAVERAREVAFVGVNSNDNDGEAEEFLRELPVPFPSYRDADLEIAASFNAVQAFPATAFYDAQGELAYVRQGAYSSEQQLAADVERYAR